MLSSRTSSALGGGYNSSSGLRVTTRQNTSSAFNENSNAVHSAKKSTILKTPGTNRTRRAFGDISNKKASLSSQQQQQRGGKSTNGKGGNANNHIVIKPAVSSKTSNSPVVTKRPSRLQPPRSGSRIPNLHTKRTTVETNSNKPRTSPLSSSSSSLTQKKQTQRQNQNQKQKQKQKPTRAAFKPRSSPVKTRQQTRAKLTPVPKKVDFQVPTRRNRSSFTANPTTITPGAKVTVSSAAPRLVQNEPVDDIELPAGRTWKQQLENGDFDEDDDSLSIGSMDDFKRTMWDDWKESLNQQRLMEAAREREEDESLKRHMELVLHEQEEGLDSLIDSVIGWGVDSVAPEDLLKEEEEWTEPASSVVEDDEDNLMLSSVLDSDDENDAPNFLYEL